MILVLAVLLAGACKHSMEEWPSDSDKQEVAVHLKNRSLSTGTFSGCRLFVYDEATQKMSWYNASADLNNTTLFHVKLYPGTYTGFCVTNAEEAAYWECAENLSPEQVYLKAQKSSDSHEEAKDYLLGENRFQVGENLPNQTSFNLDRKVGMLRVSVGNIPEWLNDLQINLSQIPKKMNLRGDYGTETYTISKKITPPERGLSETTLLLFPPKGKSVLTLSSDEYAFATPAHNIETIEANRITEIEVLFKDPGNLSSLDITARMSEWEALPIQEDSWTIDLPPGPCEGIGNGHNLVQNPGFEDSFTEGLPAAWKLDAAGGSKQVSLITASSSLREGQQAIRLEGKTYLYQDLSVSGGQCYQFKLYVNASHEKVKWRYWYTWMKGSSNLPSDAIRSTSYQYATTGYTDVFQERIFRAPSDADKLRVEIRTYTTDAPPGEGLYIDGVSVEAVD